MDRAFRLAVGQAPAELPTAGDRIQWLRDTLPTVTAEGADLLLLPELFATGYNIGDEVLSRADSDAVVRVLVRAPRALIGAWEGQPEIGVRHVEPASKISPDG